MRIDATTLAALNRQQLEALCARIELEGLQRALDSRRSAKKLRPEIPDKLQFLFESAPIKVARGGRGSGKSQSFARALLYEADDHYERVLCTRQFQSSIRDSVHQLLRQQILALGQEEWEITDREIRHTRTKSEFIFKGLQFHVEEVKSLEGITKTWIEEGQTLTQDGIDILLPTIFRDRHGRSELWISYNPEEEQAPVETNFVQNRMPGTIVSDLLTYRDNPWFPSGLEQLRAHAEDMAIKHNDYDAYNWIWEGMFRRLSEAVVFWRRVRAEPFPDPPGDTYFYHGADWGFANDPTALIRCYMTEEADGKHLWIDREVYGWRTSLDETPALFDQIETARHWPIYGDNARPETIQFMADRGFDISAAPKWSGSVEDGIEYLKSFVCIHIHSDNCPNLVQEAKLYSYKVDQKRIDPRTNEPLILPKVIDAWCHGWDATRYSLADFITSKGQALWLARDLA